MTNFDKLDKTKKIRIEEFFIEWKRYDKWKNKRLKDISSETVLSNLKKDHFMEFDHFDRLIDFIINSKGNIEERLKIILIEVSDKYLIKGRNIDFEFTFSGQVLIKRILRQKLIKKYSLSPYEVDILFSKYPKYYNDYERKIHFREDGILWVTWDEKNNNNSPFSFSSNKDEIIYVLGLNSFYLDEDLVYPVFKNIDMKDVFRPSIADANFNNDLWRPTKESFVNYGLTNPTKKIVLKNNYNTKRPEGVIDWKSITFNNLENSINSYEK